MKGKLLRYILNSKALLPSRIITGIVLLVPTLGFGQTAMVNSDQWAATDALGRKLPDISEVGTERSEKLVGMFYWTWHQDGPGNKEAQNLTQLLAQYDKTTIEAMMNNYDHPNWEGISQFFWDEPLFGYYRTTDECVLRKHAELLADAGVDVVFFDCTNGNWTWKDSYTKLLEVWNQARLDGVKIPKIAFLLPFGANENARSDMVDLYIDLYRLGLYRELWFMWNGKPLIMGYPESLVLKKGTHNTPVKIKGQPISQHELNEINDFFTFRPGQPGYVQGPTRNDHWGWLEVYPQHGFPLSSKNTYEQVCVSIAQNASPKSNKQCTSFNGPETFGRNYTAKADGSTGNWDGSDEAWLMGTNFEQQWERAFGLDPKLVWVTGWNEWIFGRFENWTGCSGGSQIVTSFPDNFDKYRSRDIEPVKSWGNKGDVYYMQLINNVRKYKGMQKQERVSEPKTIDINNTDSWKDVKPVYRSYKGNTLHRNYAGHGSDLIYTNTSGRNDIIGAKVARDDDFVYFLVETDKLLTDKSDPNWMRLFIDIDRDKSTGWGGYDFIVNRNSPKKTAIVEKSSDKWAWKTVGTAEYSLYEKLLVLKIPHSVLGVSDESELNFEFKWSDNMQEDGNIMDFYVNGDVAPGSRFNYVYTVNSSNRDIKENAKNNNNISLVSD